MNSLHFNNVGKEDQIWKTYATSAAVYMLILKLNFYEGNYTLKLFFTWFSEHVMKNLKRNETEKWNNTSQWYCRIEENKQALVKFKNAENCWNDIYWKGDRVLSVTEKHCHLNSTNNNDVSICMHNLFLPFNVLAKKRYIKGYENNINVNEQIKLF